NSRGAAKGATELDRGEPFFGGIEIPAVLNLNSGFELCKVQKIAAVDRKIFDLRARNDALNGCLFGIHGKCGAFNRDYGAFGADFQCHSTGRDVAYLNRHGLFERLEITGLDSKHVIAPRKRSRVAASRSCRFTSGLRVARLTAGRQLT